MALDIGTKRIGVALSDFLHITANPHSCVNREPEQDAITTIVKIAQENRVQTIVVGIPINMDGSRGPRAARAEEFAKLLEERLPEVPVALFDERMSTMAASRYLNETNTRGKKRKGVIDTLSAQIILQNAIDRLKN